MARQLVFTSAPQGLTPGRTGFCTVARHTDLRERLVPVLEGLSVYPPGWQPSPVICSFRLLDLGGTRIPVLSRIVDAGHDYTHRTNFLAHHLVLDPDEMAGAPTPADIFTRWTGWLNRWEVAPRWLGETDLVNLANLPPAAQPALPAQAWANLTGDAGHATLLLDGAQPATRLLRCAPGNEEDLLALFRESAALLDPAEAWHAEFTTCIQNSDTSGALRWAGLRAGSAADSPSARPAHLLDLTQPGTLPAPPLTTIVGRARSGANPLAPPERQSSAARTAAPPPKAAWKGTVNTARTAVPSLAEPSSSVLVWIIGVLAALILAGLAALVWMWWTSSHPTTNVVPSAAAAPPPIIIPPPPTPGEVAAAGAALANQQTLQDIERLADGGQYLDALARWRVLAANAPDLASAHASFLNSRLLPGAQKDWQDQLANITTQLDAAPADPATRKNLAAQLDALSDFPKNWPTPDAPALEAARADLAQKLALAGRLPDAPVWIPDELAPASAGPDYQDYSTTLNIKVVGQLLAAPAAHFQVACAPAATLALPPAEQWFTFAVQPGDFSPNDYLVLHDASRGAAGGRFLQLLIDDSSRVQLRLRIFSPTSDFFQKFPANAPLRTLGQCLWLRFSGDPPLTAFYLLLQRPAGANPAWTPLRLPFSWLAIAGPPAQVTLPGWLAQNLPLNVPSSQGFWLLPSGDSPGAVAFAKPSAESAQPAGASYHADWYSDELLQENRVLQDALAHAQEHQRELERQVLDSPRDLQPSHSDIDLAAQSVEKIQNDIIQNGADVEAAAKPDWPRTVVPWRLVYGSTSKDLTPLIEFSPDATGPTP
jgi:hypothetical protein